MLRGPNSDKEPRVGYVSHLAGLASKFFKCTFLLCRLICSSSRCSLTLLVQERFPDSFLLFPSGSLKIATTVHTKFETFHLWAQHGSGQVLNRTSACCACSHHAMTHNKTGLRDPNKAIERGTFFPQTVHWLGFSLRKVEAGHSLGPRR